MKLKQSEQSASMQGEARMEVLRDRRFLTCPACGWVHYVMTPAEKVVHDGVAERYHLTEGERQLYEATWRQCLRCEAPAHEFRVAREADLARAAGHLVTPVFVAAEVGTQ